MDLLLLNLSIFISMNLAGGSFQHGVSNVYLVAFSNLAWFFLVLVSTPYNVTKGWSLPRILKAQVAFLFIHLLVVASLVFFFNQNYSLFQIGIMYAVFLPTFFGYRMLTLYFRKILTAEVAVKNYVLIGKNDLAAEIRKSFLLNRHARFKGYVEFSAGESAIEGIREFCLREDVHEIYCCAPDVGTFEMQQLINFGLDSLIKVKMIASSETTDQAIILDKRDLSPEVDSTIALDVPRYQFIKRVFDLGFSVLFCLLIASWLFPIIALLIKLDSRGPVFFVQLRSGQGNRPFKCLKFRTMVVNEVSDSIQATRGDARITKLGHFLRRTSIDELPQFINVLIGTMSVVGPRPHMLKHTEDYSRVIKRFMGRQYVKPGITGLAQCLGYRGETRNLVDMENRVRMDRYYIENWSFLLDIKIILLTVVSLLRGSDKAF